MIVAENFEQYLKKKFGEKNSQKTQSQPQQMIVYYPYQQNYEKYLFYYLCALVAIVAIIAVVAIFQMRK